MIPAWNYFSCAFEINYTPFWTFINQIQTFNNPVVEIRNEIKKNDQKWEMLPLQLTEIKLPNYCQITKSKNEIKKIKRNSIDSYSFEKKTFDLRNVF